MTVRRFATRMFSQVVPYERSERSSPGGIKMERGGCLGREQRGENQQGTQGILQWGEHGLECDDDMGNAGHRVRGLSVDSEVVVLPKDIRLIWPGGRIERWRVYLGVECSVDDPAHGTSWLWSEGHEGAKARSETSRGRPGHPPIRPFIACLSYHFPSSSSPLPLASP